MNEVEELGRRQIAQGLVAYRSLDFILGVIGTTGGLWMAHWHDVICTLWKIAVARWVEDGFAERPSMCKAAENAQKGGKSWTVVAHAVGTGQQRDNPMTPRIPRTIFSAGIWKVWLVVRFSYELFMDWLHKNP